MLKINNYVRAKSLEEAYTLGQKKNNAILGGMLWLRLQDRTVNTAVDLCDLGLDTIEQTQDAFVIGACVTLRQLETHPGLNRLTQGAMAEAVRHIVGVQFRNLATIGGSLFGRFGFSDVLTLFLALGAKVELYERGMLDIRDFAELPRGTRDLLVRVHVPKSIQKAAYLTQRSTATDFPTLACAVCKAEEGYRFAVGARPEKAVLLLDGEGILEQGIHAGSAARMAEYIASHTRFGSNLRGSEAYRQRICAVLIRRCLEQMKEG